MATETVETVESQESLESFADNLIKGLDEDNTQEKPKRKRGRPKGSTNKKKAAEAEPTSTKDRSEEIAFVRVMAFQFGTILTSNTNTTPYTEQEADVLANAAVPVLEKYGESLMTPEVVLIGVVAMQVFPRYMDHAKHKKELAAVEELAGEGRQG